MLSHASPQAEDGLDRGDSSCRAVECPECRCPTTSLKHYPFLQVFFLGFAMSVERKTAAGCPKCVRRQILVEGGVQMLTANVLWPFVVLPLMLLRLITSCRPGHLPPNTARAGWLNVAAFFTGAFLVMFGLAALFLAKPVAILLFAAALLLYAAVVAVAFACDG